MKPFAPGDRVVWVRTARGGYGYSTEIDATVVRVGPKRVTIQVKLRNGSEALRLVAPENLKPDPLLPGERIDFGPLRRCLARSPGGPTPTGQLPSKGTRCGLPADHDGDHTVLIPTGMPWFGTAAVAKPAGGR